MLHHRRQLSMDVSMRSPDAGFVRNAACQQSAPALQLLIRPPTDVAVLLEPAILDEQVSPFFLTTVISSAFIITAFPTASHHQNDSTVSNYQFQHRQAPITNLKSKNRRNSMKKDDKHANQPKPERKIIRHPTAPFSTKSIIINLIIAFFLYILRRGIEAGGKSAITKYSRFIK